MKLATSTLGCPSWTLEEIVTRLPRYGYDGVELRGLGADLELSQSPAFASPSALARTRAAFAEAGLEVCSVDSSARFADADATTRAQNVDLARTAIDLAVALGAPSVRVFGGVLPDTLGRDAGTGYVAEALRTLGEYAAQTGQVSVLLETHDSFSTGAQAAEVLRAAAHPQVGALWDLHHPYRQGEAPEETLAALAPYTRLTHVKDSVPGGTYCLLGEGDVPIRHMIGLLRQNGYGGYLSVEWEKRWIPDLPDPEIAFPQYATVLRDYVN